MDYLNEYYSRYDEEGRLLSRHGQVEYRTTMKYIRESLAGISDPSILEIGAGTGRYSVTLAKEGYRVTAVELIERNLQQLRRPYVARVATHRLLQTFQVGLVDIEVLVLEAQQALGVRYHLLKLVA